MLSQTLRYVAAAVAFLVSGASAFCQSDSLALSSASTFPGGTASLTLSLTSPSGNQPAALQWTVSYSPSDVTAITAIASPGSISNGKTILCAGSPGSYTCFLSGLNVNTIQDGVVAIINITVSTTVTTTSIGITNALGASPAGLAIPTTATGGVISVGQGPALSALTCNSVWVLSGNSSTCTVTLNQAAPALGAVVSLSSNSPVITVPDSVTVPGGASSANFMATAGTVSTTQTAAVTATFNGTSQQVSLSVASQLVVSSIGCSPSSLTSNASTTCTVTLNRNVYSPGVTVGLADNSLLVTTPDSVVVPNGSNTVSFTATAGIIPINLTAIITASLGSSLQSTILTLLPTGASQQLSITCNQTAVVGGVSIPCSVQLSAPAKAGGVIVDLAVSDPAILPPSSVQLPEGSRVAQFVLRTRPADHDRNATIVARTSSSVKQTTISVLALKPSSLACAPPGAPGPEKLLCEVHLNARPAEAVTLAVSGSINVQLPVKIVTRPEQSSLTFEALVNPSAISREVSVQVRFGGQVARDRRTVGPSSPASAAVNVPSDSGLPHAAALVNAGTQSPAAVCTPGSVASLLGQSLSDTSTPGGAGATRIYVNGNQAPILSATSTRVDFLCPQGTPGATFNVWLENAAGRTDSLAATLRKLAPGIFTLDNSTQGLIFFDDSSLATVRSFAAAGQPAQPGDELSIRSTGFSADDSISVKLGDIDAPVSSVQPVDNLPGVYDIRIQVPAGAPVGDAVPAILRIADSAGAWAESNLATLAIELPRP